MEASKSREARLKGLSGTDRGRVFLELRARDGEVAALSRGLALKSLEAELEYIYRRVYLFVLGIRLFVLRDSGGRMC